MDKQKKVEEMAKHGCYDGCASGLRKFCDEYDGKPCKNMVRIASGLYEQSYRKIPKNAVVLTEEELFARDERLHKADREYIKALEDCINNRNAKAYKEMAEKFARLVEFHSISTIDNEGREIFTISALGLKEILHEEFDIPYDEEITEEREIKEKELTDEELIKALEFCINNVCSLKCPIHNDTSCVQTLRIRTLDLIHRLQNDKKELKSIAEYQQGSNIERWRIIQEKDKTIAKQNAEIERLTRELDDTVSMNEMYIKEVKQNSELQKQVDELTKPLYDEDLFNLGYAKAVKDKAKEIERELEDKGYFEYGQFTISGNDFIEIFKKRGVEVE